jgi:hypothetical protein
MSDSNTYFNEKNATVFSAEELVAIFRRSNEKIAALHTYSSDDFNELSHHIRNYYQQATDILENISRLDGAARSSEKNVTVQAQESLRNISAIVTKLQFHDIIRQQLEHIQQTNDCIIEELLSVSRQHVRTHARETYKYLSLVPDIARLHVAQLTHTNKEYQEAFADIKASLQSIRQQTDTIAGAYTALHTPANQPEGIIRLAHTLSSAINESLTQIRHCEAFEQTIEEINQNLTGLISQNDRNKEHADTSENKLITQLKDLYTMESERIVHEQAFGKNPVAPTRNETDDNLELF